MGFQAEQKNVYDLFNRQSYSVPRNQRRYVWEKRNLEELFDDISLVVEGACESHFLGSFVLKVEGRENGLPTYTIIDGQQRIITLTILLASILYWLRKENLTDDFEGTKQYVIAKDDKARDVVMVKSDYHLSLESIINGILEPDDVTFKEISIKELIENYKIDTSKDENIINAFKFFLNNVKNKLDSAEDRAAYLVALRDATVGISYIGITSTSEEDSYTIFEILNARGIDLEDHELLKNYIMRYIQPETSRDKAKIIWGDIENELGKNIKKFVKHYATHRYGYGKNRDSGLTVYKAIQSANRGRDTEKLLNDLKMKADYYSIMINPTEARGSDKCSEHEERIFSFFKKKRQEQLRPVILSLIHMNRIGKLDDKKYNDALTYIYNFYVCYNIIGEENSNKLTNTVYKFAEKIENVFSEDVLLEFSQELKRKMPSKEIFVDAFKGVGWSHHSGFYEGEKNKERVQTVLEVWERHINNDIFPNDFTIEHILDDADSDDNGQIGNIIPLERRLNNNLSEKTYEQKLEKYAESSYKMSRNFASRYKGKEFKPEERGKILAEKFYDEVLLFSIDDNKNKEGGKE